MRTFGEMFSGERESKLSECLGEKEYLRRRQEFKKGLYVDGFFEREGTLAGVFLQEEQEIVLSRK